MDFVLNRINSLKEKIEERKDSPDYGLMKEMLANEVITKSVVCSLFNERAAALQDGKSDVDSLVKGFYQDTPDYLVNEEIRMLKDVGR